MTTGKHIINCDINPSTRGLVYHKKMGKIIWDPERIKLYLSDQQIAGGHIDGSYFCFLEREAESTPVLNINVLHFLLANPYLIPEEWKNYKRIFFLGTMWGSDYAPRSYGGFANIYIPFLCWMDDSYREGNYWSSSGLSVGNSRGPKEPAALLKI